MLTFKIVFSKYINKSQKPKSRPAQEPKDFGKRGREEGRGDKGRVQLKTTTKSGIFQI